MLTSGSVGAFIGLYSDSRFSTCADCEFRLGLEMDVFVCCWVLICDAPEDEMVENSVGDPEAIRADDSVQEQEHDEVLVIMQADA